MPMPNHHIIDVATVMVCAQLYDLFDIKLFAMQPLLLKSRLQSHISYVIILG